MTRASNPHIFITGRSGSGKSYLLRELLLQASAQGALCLVFDYTGDYQEHDPPAGISARRISVSSPDFTLNPLLGSVGQPELPAQQFLSLIHGVFRLGNRTSLALRKTVTAYLQQTQGVPTLQELVEYVGTSQPSSQGTESAIEVLDLIASILACGNKPISLDLTTPGIVVLDFSVFADVQMRNLLLSMIINAIWSQRTAAKASTQPLVLLLDEAQTLPWGTGSIIQRILREGRKYGIGGWFAAQWMSNKEAAAALEQAYLRVHFRPDEENVRRLSRHLVQGAPEHLKECVRLVRSLKVGQCVLQRPDGGLVKIYCKFDQGGEPRVL